VAAEAPTVLMQARGAALWPFELQKVASTLEAMRTEISGMKPMASTVLTSSRTLAERFNVAASVASRIPELAHALQVLTNVSASATRYVRNVSYACDEITRMLDAPGYWSQNVDGSAYKQWMVPQAPPAFRPVGVWVPRDPSAYSHGSHSWEGIAERIAQLGQAHRAAGRPHALCPSGELQSRLHALSIRVPGVLNEARDPGLFFSAVSGAVLDVQVESVCLILAMLADLRRQLRLPVPDQTLGLSPTVSAGRRLQGLEMREHIDNALFGGVISGSITRFMTPIRDALEGATDPCHDNKWEPSRVDRGPLDCAKVLVRPTGDQCSPTPPPCGSYPHFNSSAWPLLNRNEASDGANLGICSAGANESSLYAQCYPVRSDEEMAETTFRRNFLHFHFGTMPPVSFEDLSRKHCVLPRSNTLTLCACSES
jgi:hypothetical protein